ncbi:MAG TPA: hypothetical protein VLB85_10685 [Acidimicrobiia bacterium]|nr:hypothetical protein [Acidimicrobiia bacterium]
MAEQTRRIGCGCLPLIGLFLIGSVLLGAVEDVTDGAIDSRTVLGALVVFGFLSLLVAGISRRRASERHDRDDDGMPAPAAPATTSTYRPPAAPPPRTEREVRTGTRELKTQIDDPASQAFKQRLADAVADLADNVEEMPGPGSGQRRLTSAEMVERAKRHIADFGSNDS